MEAAPRPAKALESLAGFGEQVRGPREGGAFALAERREHSLLSLFELSRELSVSLDLYHTADLALLNLMGHFGTSRGALWILPDEFPLRAVLIRAHGLREDVARALGAGLGPQMADQYTYEQGPVLLADWAEAMRAPGADLALEAGLAVLAPVTSHGRLMGLVALGTRVSEGAYWPLDLEYLSAACGMVGVALQNTRLYHRLLESNRQLHQVNARLHELDALKSRFVQNANHELRTPLAIMIGYLEVLLDAPETAGAQRKTLGTVAEQARKLKGLVENLLDFSAMPEGGLETSCEEGDVGALVRRVYEARRPGVMDSLRELELHLAAGLPAARFDARRLEQALNLLLDNAVKLTPLGSAIKLVAQPWSAGGQNRVRVQVADNGPGIRKDQLDSLFDAIRQMDGSPAPVARGMGPGLALVKEIAEKMGGALEAASELGVGTTFSLLLPAVAKP